ncbi:MAG: Pyruvate kinase [uncultured Thermomicrobiales bacterium]|uniref:Pyruvate kinase n=1 Tax=uncultured Thermomicrobiales bacterium TaxID=1645740 RepID=A0A6J4VRT9_9BACT|nr:MAG: Pyruvate kinase [uncultured Thermomicrobiales bacterium]
MERRVKIVATLGPASGSSERLGQLLEAGVDVFRINAAHGSADDRALLIQRVRGAAERAGRRVPILFDLRGLKIRSGPLAEGAGAVPIARGSRLRLVASPIQTTTEVIGIDYPLLLDVIAEGSRILISDGLIELLVERVGSDHAVTTVSRGGQLMGKQGVTLPGAPIKGGALTDADKDDVAFAVAHGVDYLGLSFINDAGDLQLARDVALACGGAQPGLVAKIERPEALANLREIAGSADGVMVARGDLGVQLPPERVPRAQKEIIGVANQMGLPVITATQMLESMITQPVATRAETSDVANAVWDGTDAVMLSAETAVGKYPVEAVLTMDRIIKEVEKEGPIRSQSAAAMATLPDDASARFADAIARAAFALGDQTPAGLLVVFTKTGSAVRRIAKYRPGPPIIAVADNELVARRLQMVWGVESVVVEVEENPDSVFRKAGQTIIEAGLAEEGEYALIVGSLPMTQKAGQTNLVHVRKLGT